MILFNELIDSFYILVPVDLGEGSSEGWGLICEV